MERAAHLIKPFTRDERVLGVLLVGSASRPFRDHVSDYDFEVIVDDETYARMPDAERHQFAMDPEIPTRVDYEFLNRPWSELDGLRHSTRDLDHHPFRHAEVMYDPTGNLEPLVREIGRLPDAVRALRCRVHYLELLASTRRAAKCVDRGEDAMNLRLLAADAVAALTKLLFLLAGSWPAMRHWASHELRLLGTDPALLTRMAEALEDPRPERLSGLFEDGRAQLDAHGFDFHHDPAAFRIWAFLTDEGKAAFLDWGSR